jgi:hypothetical protein
VDSSGAIPVLPIPKSNPLSLVGRAVSTRSTGIAPDWSPADDEISRLTSFGKLPGAWSAVGLTGWPDFVSALADCGYAVTTADPGPGAVLGFDRDGQTIVLAQGVRSPAEYVDPIAATLALHAESEGGPDDHEQR